MAQEVADGIGDVVPDLPEGLGNRPGAKWEPLFTVALRADKGDPEGYWSRLCAEAYEQLDASLGPPDLDDGEGNDMDATLAAWEVEDAAGWGERQ